MSKEWPPLESYPPFILLRRNRPTAKKDHTCNTCGHKIERGHKYVIEVFMEGDTLKFRKEHNFDCTALLAEESKE